MKASKIYVGVNGATLSLTNGKGVAVYPAQKGDKESYILMDSGKKATLKGARINGVGVARFLSENGFALAEPGNPHAAILADMLDCHDGTKLVEEASQLKAAQLQKRFANQVCTFVPFASEKPMVQVTVTEPRGFTSVHFDLVTGFGSGAVQLEHSPGSGMFDASICAGWLVGPDDDATVMPRVSEYGGIVEHAAYVICHSGLASLVGEANMHMDYDATVDAPFPRGVLELALENGDRIQVGINAVDDLVVRYVRGGNVMYSRTGMTRPRLAEVIGDIAAVIIRARDLDATPVKKRL